MRGRPGSVAEISVLPTGISVSDLENFALSTRDVSEMNSNSARTDGFVCCISTAIRVAKAMIGAKVTLC